MKIEIIMNDEFEQDILRSLLSSDEHRVEFASRLLHLCARALRFSPGEPVSLIITLEDEHDAD